MSDVCKACVNSRQEQNANGDLVPCRCRYERMDRTPAEPGLKKRAIALAVKAIEDLKRRRAS